jgi:hypothetical protein
MSAASQPLPDPLQIALEWVRSEAKEAIKGQGGHDTQFGVCCTLYNGFELSDGDVETAFRHYNDTKSHPPLNEGGIKHKLSGAKAQPFKYPAGWLYRKMCREKGFHGFGQSSTGSTGPRVAREPKFEQKWKLEFDEAALKKVQPGFAISEEWLREKSPVDVTTCDARKYLESVFGPEDKVLIFTRFGSQGQFMFWRGRGFRLASRDGIQAVPSELPTSGPDGVWYLSQPVTGKWEPNPRETDEVGRPKMSRRSEESVADWQHMVLEADPVDEVKRDPARFAQFNTLWLGFLANLPLPIKAIYTSGGKSIHALVWLPAATKERYDAKKKLVGPLFSKLGSDPRALKAVQLTRLPCCMRGQNKQRLLFLNPSPDPDGIELIKGGWARV